MDTQGTQSRHCDRHLLIAFFINLQIPLIFSHLLFFRITNPDKASQILQEVKQKIKSFPFNFRGAVILSGQEEGVYGWVTVNYLLENFIKVLSC